MTAHREPPDQASRMRALSELDTNFLVEAGAGSGKTTLLAGRMAALVESGIRTSHIAAVTFTRKAAGELRERFQLALERALDTARSANHGDRIGRLGTALADIDEAFLGTIHAFCARLLRERPIEAGLDPTFREVEPDEATELGNAWWHDWLDRLHMAGDADLQQMLDLGIEPDRLASAFAMFVRFPDVDFSASPTHVPDVAAVRVLVEQLLDRANHMMPRDEPDSGWDALQLVVRRLLFERRNDGWNSTPEFCDTLAGIGASNVTQNRWIGVSGDDKKDKAAAKALGEEFERLKSGDVARVVREWRAHRYPPVATLLRRAADEFATYRVASGILDFEDLLLHAARLLASDADARRALGERFRHVLVDEFQDTDPVQAQVLFLLASDPLQDAGGASWTTATLRPGALFVVGDPKQSIYRFRRADITTYAAAKALLAQQGAVLPLTANFRSVPAVAALVNAHFGDANVFPPTQTPQQASFAPMEPMRDAATAGGVFYYDVVGDKARPSAEAIVAMDAAWVASVIEARINAKVRAPEDFLILCRSRASLAAYARELAQRNIPASVSGALTDFATELQELQVVLQLLDDPTSSILTVAALEGVFVGATPADLWAAKQAGISFQIAVAAPSPASEDAERAGRVRAGLGRLHTWLALSRRVAPDELLEVILDETGLLARTAAGDLGDQRAGLLLDLVTQVRSATIDGTGSATTALAVLDRLLAAEAPEASLRPGRTDAVRVMNLHKAKGLEAKVVFLAAPTLMKDHDVEVAVRRDGDVARGGMRIVDTSKRAKVVLAAPADWDAQSAAEQAFLDAEEDRLLYVAATRACDELVIARLVVTPAKGPPRLAGETAWGKLQPTLEGRATAIEHTPTEATGREQLDERGPEIAVRAHATEGARRQAALAGYHLTTVSRSAKPDAAERGDQRHATGAGAAWGRAVHRTLEWLGRDGGEGALNSMAVAIAQEEQLTAPLDAEALVRLVERAMRRPEWKALITARERVVEFPVMEWRTGGGTAPVFVEGVIDAAYRDEGGWTVLDWKTDLDDASWATRRPQYQAQVDQYASMLGRATGRPSTGALVRLVDTA